METSRLPIFKERFIKLRGSLTQAQFAEKLNIARPTVGLYESGARIPDALALKNIAEKCGVSSDWLLGISKTKSPDPKIREVCEFTGLSESAILELNRQCKSRLNQHFAFDALNKIIENISLEIALYSSHLVRVQLEASNYISEYENITSDSYSAMLTNGGDILKRLEDDYTELELAEYRFSKLCAKIANMYDTDTVLSELEHLIERIEELDNDLYEVNSNGEHKED